MIEKPEHELAPLEEERHKLANGRTLFMLGRPGCGYQIWLDSNFDFSGIGLGTGATKQEAREAAIQLLLAAVRTLRGLQGGGEAEVKRWTT